MLASISMKGSDTTFSLPSLFCQEDESCLNEVEDPDMNLNSSFCFSQSDDEYIQMLIEKETTFESNCSDKSKSLLKCARLDAIEWTLNTRSFFGFHLRTAYLSLTYFDRFFSRRSIDNGKVWAIRLLAVACLSLAAKMEEGKVPALSEYYVDEYNFESNVIQRMELLVLNTLEWKMGSITPFEFLHYFITKFCNDSSPPKDLVTRAVELIYSVMKEISLMDHRPSVIAAAAVLAASDDQLTRKTIEFKFNVISSWGFVEKEHLFSCYNLLVEIEMEKYKTPKSLISSNTWSIHSSSGDVLHNSSVTFGAGTKRKLTYNVDYEKQSPLQKIRRA